MINQLIQAQEIASMTMTYASLPSQEFYPDSNSDDLMEKLNQFNCTIPLCSQSFSVPQIEE